MSRSCSRSKAEHVARRIAAPFDDVQLFGFDGCHANDFVSRVMGSLAGHPNLYGLVVVSLGCEMLDPRALSEPAKAAGREVGIVTIQSEGGTTAAINKGRELVSRMLLLRDDAPQGDFFLSDLRVGSNCGGSDATSGLSANPAVGALYDLLIDSGATCFFDEITEMMGCADMASARTSPRVAAKIREAIDRAIDTAVRAGMFGIATGNAEGGLTSIEEKSLGHT